MADEVPAQDAQLIKERKEKFVNFFKVRYQWISYIFLAALVWLAVRIRTRNVGGLRDVTTGGWTLGPDLDPFLFLRWAKEIVVQGSVMPLDTMRYVPIGFETKQELVLLSYLIAWFHKIASFFGSISVEQSAALFPVAMFALTVIAFFLMVRIMFRDMMGIKKANITALIASFFLIVMPSLLPRTIAGIPEKESVGFLFLFATFYCFIASWKAKTSLHRYIFAVASGIFTALMALVWGGYVYVFVTIGLTFFILFLFGQITKEKAFLYTTWLFVAVAVTLSFTVRYSLTAFITSSTTALSFFNVGLIIVHALIFKTRLRKYVETEKLSKIPAQFISLGLLIILSIIFISIINGPNFILEEANNIKNALVTPITDRVGVTVAENKQPYFNEWSSNFGPTVKIVNNIPLTFWLFVIGSIYLFYHMLKAFTRKDRFGLTASYTFFLIAIIFSRKDPSSILNGVNSTSLLLYALGFIVLGGSFLYYYYKLHKKGEDSFKHIDIGAQLLFAFFFFSIVSARGAVRLIMVLVPAASIMISYFAVSSISDARHAKSDLGKLICYIIAALVLISLIFSGYQLFKVSEYSAGGFIPSSYTQQWQKAMAWVRDNTPQNAVFGHWWDYGYWVQTLGERATVLDGGNALGYWDYLMGRHGLTAPASAQKETLEFLYSHNTTHFLIDSTDIGKYPAFSSIGSDIHYDRRSWLQFFGRERIINETKNSVFYLYSGGTPLDGDVIYESQNGTRVLLPEGRAALAALLIEINKSGDLAGQPRGIYMYQKSKSGLPEQYLIPLRYADQKGKFIDFGSGIEAGIFFMPQFIQQGNQPKVERDTIIMYLSNKTVTSQLARLYLYKEKNPYFKLVHNEDSDFVRQLKSYNLLNENEDIIYYQGFNGPISIWEINYPSNVSFNSDYIARDFPGVNPLISV